MAGADSPPKARCEFCERNGCSCFHDVPHDGKHKPDCKWAEPSTSPMQSALRDDLRRFGQACYDQGYELGRDGKELPQRDGRASWLEYYGWLDGKDSRG